MTNPEYSVEFLYPEFDSDDVKIGTKTEYMCVSAIPRVGETVEIGYDVIGTVEEVKYRYSRRLRSDDVTITITLNVNE